MVIVGGGPAGLALGLALQRHGVDTLILETAASIRELPRGELLQPNGLQVLGRLQVLDALLSQDVCRFDTVHMYGAGGRPLIASSYGLLDPPHNYVVAYKPHLLRQVLLTHLAGARIWWDARPERIEREQRTWRITVRGGEGERVVRAPVVVGADGVRSIVREALGIRATVRPYSDAYALTVIPLPHGFGVGGRQYYGGGALLGLLPVSTTELYVYWHVPAARLEDFPAWSAAELRERLCAVAPDIGPGLDLPPPSAWLRLRPVRVDARSWVADGGAVIGDAAHALNPNAAQGTNQALQDAWVLAETVAECLRAGRLQAADLRRYEHLRRPAAEFAQGLGEFYAYWWTSRNPLVNALHLRTARNIARHPRILRKIVAQTAGVDCSPLGLSDRLRLLL